MQISVQNYQSIRDVSIETNGFTVITGKSNIGKSALMRAIRSGLFGESGESYIRRGTDSCNVIIKDGEVNLNWTKVSSKKTSDKNQTKLNLNGDEFIKIGRTHAEYIAPFNWKIIDTKTDKFTPQVAFQHDPIFLVSATDSAVAEVFKYLSRVDVVTDAQSIAKQENRKSETKLKVVEEEENNVRQEIAQWDYIDDIRKKFNALEENLSLMKREEDGWETTIEKIDQITELSPLKIPSSPSLGLPREKITQLELLTRLDKLQPITIPTKPVFETTIETQNLLMAIDEAIVRSRELATLIQESKELEETIISLGEEKKTLQKELGICPLCGQEFPHG